MISVVVDYENFLGEKRKKELWFHLSTNDLTDVNLKDNDARGLIGVIGRLTEAKDYKGIKDNFDTLVNLSYGTRSADGEYFDKDPKETARFKNSAAYEVLFHRFINDADFAAEFVNGIMPDHKQTKAKVDTAQMLNYNMNVQTPQAAPTGYMGSAPVQQVTPVPQATPVQQTQVVQEFQPRPVDNYGSYK
jgi:hypothetical protein